MKGFLKYFYGAFPVKLSGLNPIFDEDICGRLPKRNNLA